MNSLIFGINETINDNNYLGIFAYVYRRTTAKIEEAIRNDRFEEKNVGRIIKKLGKK